MAEMPRYSSLFSGSQEPAFDPTTLPAALGCTPQEGGDIWTWEIGPDLTQSLASGEGIPLPAVTGELCHLVSHIPSCLLNLVSNPCCLSAHLLWFPSPCGALMSSLSAASCWHEGETLPAYARGSEMGQRSPAPSPPVPARETLLLGKQGGTSWWVLWMFL